MRNIRKAQAELCLRRLIQQWYGDNQPPQGYGPVLVRPGMYVSSWAIVWDGPDDWPFNALAEREQPPKGVWLEPINAGAVALHPK